MGVNYRFPRVNLVIIIYIGKKSVHRQTFYGKIELSMLAGTKVTHSGNFENHRKKLPPQKITIYHVHGKLPVNT